MFKRIFGIETEYGLLINSDDPDHSPSWLAHRVIDQVFRVRKQGVLDLHYRGYDEPPGNGGFLLNAGRLYVDMGHLEFASPECHTLADIVASDRAGDRLLQRTLVELNLDQNISLIKNNIDHETDATFGCHENYLVSRDFPFNLKGLNKLIPFLVTRQIFTGAGRIGVTEIYDGWVPIEQLSQKGSGLRDQHGSPTVPFQISQRADHIVNDFFEWVQNNRALINTRDEPLADPNQFRRIHLLLGDSNMAEVATALKMGTTGIVLQLIEDGHAPVGLDLEEPIQTLKDISRDSTRKWNVRLANGQTRSAIDIQEDFLKAAQDQYAGQDDDTDWVLDQWESVLRDLRGDYTKLVGRVDWASKLWLLESFKEEEKLEWDDPWLKSLDLEYHNLNPEKSLYFGLEEEGRVPRVTTNTAIDLAMQNPPRNTRAFGRSELIRQLVGKEWNEEPSLEPSLERRFPHYVINWSIFQLRGQPPFPMPNPFKTYVKEVREHLAEPETQVQPN